VREPAPNLDRDDIRGVTRPLVAGIGIEDLVCPRRRKNGTNFGRLLPNTDRFVIHRLAALALRLIDWRNR